MAQPIRAWLISLETAATRVRLCAVAAALCVAAALTLTPAAAAEDTGWLAVADDATESLALAEAWPRLDPKRQFLAIEQLLAAGRVEEAATLLDHTRYEGPVAQSVQRFYQGRIARARGHNAEAVAIFRQELASHPEQARVRLELAATLFSMQQDESARHNFELVLGGAGADPNLQNAVRSYINAIDARKRWDVTSFLTIAPTTNLNQGSSSQTVLINGLPFELADANVKKSGVGVNGGFQAGYRQPLTGTMDLVASAGAQTKRYRDVEFDDSLVNASLGPKWHFDGGFIGLYGLVDHAWKADDDYSTSFGGLVSAGVTLTSSDQLFADAGCNHHRYVNDWQGADLRYQNGRDCFVAAHLDHYFDSQSYARLLGSAGEVTTGQAHLDSFAKSIGIGAYHEFPLGLSVYAQGQYTASQYEGVYPVFDVARHDDRYDASVNLTKRDFALFGLAPMLQYTYTHNASNIPLQEFDAQGIALTLTNRF